MTPQQVRSLAKGFILGVLGGLGIAVKGKWDETTVAERGYGLLETMPHDVHTAASSLLVWFRLCFMFSLFRLLVLSTSALTQNIIPSPHCKVQCSIHYPRNIITFDSPSLRRTLMRSVSEKLSKMRLPSPLALPLRLFLWIYYGSRMTAVNLLSVLVRGQFCF